MIFGLLLVFRKIEFVLLIEKQSFNIKQNFDTNLLLRVVAIFAFFTLFNSYIFTQPLATIKFLKL